MKPPKIKGGMSLDTTMLYDVHFGFFFITVHFCYQGVDFKCSRGKPWEMFTRFFNMRNAEPRTNAIFCSGDLGCVFWLICKSTTNRLTELKDLKTW